MNDKVRKFTDLTEEEKNDIVCQAIAMMETEFYDAQDELNPQSKGKYFKENELKARKLCQNADIVEMDGYLMLLAL